MINGSLDRSTLISTSSQLFDESSSDFGFEKAPKTSRIDDNPLFEKQGGRKFRSETPTHAPQFVRNCFVTHYTAQDSNGRCWNAEQSVINDDLLSDGPCGIGSEAKQTFLKSIFESIRSDSIKSDDEEDSVNQSLLFSANLSKWSEFKSSFERILLILKKEHFYTYPFQLRNALAISSRNFRENHFHELIQMIELVMNEHGRAPARSNFLLLLANYPKENMKLILTLLSSDSFFWNDLEKSAAPFFKNLKGIWDLFFKQIRFEKFNQNDLSIDELFKKCLKIMFNSNVSILELRFTQIQLFGKLSEGPISCKSFDRLLLVVKEINSFFSKNKTLNTIQNREKIQHVIQLISNHFFKTLMPIMEDSEFHFPKIPENSENMEIFRKVLEIFSDPSFESLGICLNDDAFDLLCGVYATPELMESLLFSEQEKGKYNFKLLKLILDKCIPPNPFHLKPHNSYFSEWLSDNTNISKGLNVHYFPKFPEFRVYRFFFLKNMGWMDNQIFKRYFPYLDLKQKLIEKGFQEEPEKNDVELKTLKEGNHLNEKRKKAKHQ